MLTPKATTAYFDAQLLLKSNTADITAALALKADRFTAYTITHVDNSTSTEGQSVNHLHKD